MKGLLRKISDYEPNKLWIIADGPTLDQGEVGRILCAQARAEAEKGVTWPCQIKKIYAEISLGLNQRINSGLDVVFEHEDRLVILEEDCHPKREFFPFMETMLERYANEEKVGAVSGNCYLPFEAPLESDYFFSRYLQIWGWASWRRAWKVHRAKRSAWPVQGMKYFFPESSRAEQKYWDLLMKRIESGGLQSWDYDLLLTFWKNQWLALLPAQNLVENLGLGPDATNTGDADTNPGWQRQGRLVSPYRSPGQILKSESLDSLIFQNHYKRMSGRKSIFEKIQHLFA